MADHDADADCEAMLRLQAGEDTALNEIMTRWQQPLANFIFRSVGNEAEAIDLAQETFVRVYENRGRYRPSGKFSTWLFTIAINLCRNQARWKARHPVAELDETLADSALQADDAAMSGETVAAVRIAVAELPHELRTALVLFEYEDKSYADIAALLNCSSKAVETRIYRAKKILRGKLAGWL